MHHDRALSGAEIGSYREDKSETQKRQGLGRFTLASALPLRGAANQFLCQSVAHR